MRSIAAAIVASVLFACDLAADLWLNNTSDNDGWDSFAAIGYVMFLVVLASDLWIARRAAQEPR